MTDHEKRLLLQGMSLARGVLKRIACPERWHIPIRNYQNVLADAWDLDVSQTSTDRERAEFDALLCAVNDAVGAKHQDWTDEDGRKWRKH